jgi:hypothetical protein
MNFLEKVLRGDSLRPTRLHTEKGDFAGLWALPGFFPASVSWLTHRIFGWKALCPWWVYGAIRFVAKNLQSNDSVLEDGAGVSSVWFAQRCGKVVSIEQSNYWKRIVESEASKRQIENLDVILTPRGDKVFSQLIEKIKWDVIVIDGLGDRVAIFKALLVSSLRPRMIIYDNTDRRRDSDVCVTTSFQGYSKRVFRGFGPQTVHAWETTVFVSNES